MSETRYLVLRLGWHQNPHGDNYMRRLPTVETVAVHDTFDDAEAECRRREYEIRIGENPFRFGGASLFFQTSLDGPRLHDWLLDGGIEPPIEQLSHRSWREWWDGFAHMWTESQIGHAWCGLNKVRFYEIAAEEVAETFQVLVRHRSAFGVNALHPDDRKSGMIQGIFRNARLASMVCEERNRSWYGDEVLHRHRKRGTPLLFELSDVLGEVAEENREPFLLERRAFDRFGRAGHDIEGRDSGSRIPLRLFGSRFAAERACAELIEASREALNPFQVFTPVMTGRSKREFTAAIERIDAPLPCPANLRTESWREWWDLCQGEITEDQRGAAWALFGNQALFEVRRVELEG